ncbi:hypothetical protein [Halioxenophilus aromaticivorans]|uniref:Nuclear transport factor 2 family protein n=1 Tax=Halioxenophilus aromaticivorans TaxID=1306992 RepID=A0AAV3U3E2_9ALTE
MNDKIIEVVDRQLAAYNRKDAAEWASTYAVEAVQRSIDGEILANGRAEIQKNIAARFLEPDLNASIIERRVYDDTVIDHELIIRNFPEGLGSVEMLCIYSIENNLIKSGIFKVFNKKLTKPSI